MKEKIILIGGGGHCKSCIDVIEQQDRFDIVGVVERIGHTEGGGVLGYPILGTDHDLSELRKRVEYAIITVGQTETPEPRIQLFDVLKKLDFSLPVIIAHTSYVSRHSLIGEGTIVMHQTLVNAGARIGINCIINTKALVEHDAVVEEHCHIATGAIVNGGATIGTGSFFGSAAVSKQYVSISPRSFIKANSMVGKRL
ncbi:MAG: NeuD/PglB/VioB family sugar acetyltransferase [Deltaproteobacteria bacterium]|nr:NeuD/PglB/VioB family sugar acetyltransferase [Deltaproteobacteria bacterium]